LAELVATNELPEINVTYPVGIRCAKEKKKFPCLYPLLVHAREKEIHEPIQLVSLSQRKIN